MSAPVTPSVCPRCGSPDPGKPWRQVGFGKTDPCQHPWHKATATPPPSGSPTPDPSPAKVEVDPVVVSCAVRADDTGDIEGVPSTVVQVANWADVARAVREKPTGAEIQQWATYHRETL